MPSRKKPGANGEPAATPAAKKKTTRRKPAVSRTPPPVENGAGESQAIAAEAPARGRSNKPDLVIVESPAKAKTINHYLGSGYVVKASIGHVRDLPKRRGKGEVVAGVDIDNGWTPRYVVVEREDKGGGKGKGKFTNRRSAKDVLAELKKEAARCNRIYLATDPDREGEAIAWHIEDALKLDDKRTFRITFNEITPNVIRHAIAHPGKINQDRVHAQEARRILDRVVGYPLSGLLGKKVTRGLSAGRVQSVALRLVVDREREIEAFKSEEYWKITALLSPEGLAKIAATPKFSVVLSKTKGVQADQAEEKQTDEKHAEEKPHAPETPEGTFLAGLEEWLGKKFAVKDETTAMIIAGALDSAVYKVLKVEQKDRQDKAPPPFTTSRLQQQANIRLRFTGERTMRNAQKLYEGVDLGPDGSVALITYMRTDSTRVSADALNAVRDLIDHNYGKAYLPDKPNFFASGKSAQEAHEAIRPTDLSYTPARVDSLLSHSTPHRSDLIRLYTLIYNQFVASQMKPAIFAVTSVEIDAATTIDSGPATGLFKARGEILKFDGYRKVLAPASKKEDALLPPLKEQQKLDRLDLTSSQHFTQPPPRYNEAALIRALEKEGIGRPSTYAAIIGKITSEDRGYIQVKERGRFYATELGKRVTDLLVEHFPKVMDVKFTSQMEEDLDQIETGKTKYAEVLTEFWGPFSEALKKAEEGMPELRGKETGEACPRCGRPLVVKYSKKTGNEFIGCSGYKEGCKYIKPGEGEPEREAPIETEHKCPTCGKTMLLRKGKRGEFLSCSGYPECKTTMNFDAEGKPVLASRPTDHVCDKCGKPMVLREGPRGPFLACTGYPKCKNAKDVDAQGNPVQPVSIGVNCEKCGSPMLVRRGPRGPFLGCSGFPKCRGTKQLTDEMKEQLKDALPAPAPKKALPQVEVSETCPECGSAMRLQINRRRGNYFLGCTQYPKCKGTRQVTPEMQEQLTAAGAAT